MDWGSIQTRLFERDAEQSQLLEVFERQIEYDAAREFTLITGRSGTGKTALASTLQCTSKIRGGSFIKGKFDQFQKAEPYAPFKAAFTAFSNSVIAQGSHRTSVVKGLVGDCVDSMDAAILVNVVPSLCPLLEIPEGEMPTSFVLGADELQRQKRINVAFCNFTSAICSPEKPLVILIDDMQWADTCSLRLLCALLTSDDIDGLVLLGTCRHNEVDYGDELSILLRKLEDDMNLDLNEIYLENLDVNSVERMLIDVYTNLHPATLQPLVDFVFKTTNGNILFIFELLKSLEEEGCIHADSDDTDSLWYYDETRMLSSKYTKSVQTILVNKISGLFKPIKEILQVAACIGSEFDEKMLHDLVDPTHLSEALDVATSKNLILEGDSHGSYKFAHDSIQRASYLLIPSSERANYHLIIGRDLHNALCERNDLESNLYLVVNQLQQGIDLVESADEKNMIAELCLKAGENSVKSSDYSTAASYFEFAIGILGDDHWRHQYRLSLSLFNVAAEMFYCTGRWKKMNVLIDTVLENAISVHDRVRCNITQVLSLAATHRFDEATMAAFAVLNDLGENLVQDVGKLNLASRLGKTKILLMLQGRRIENIDKFRLMTDRNQIDIMEILQTMYTVMSTLDSKLLPLIVFRMLQLTLQHGICSSAPIAFSAYGAVMTSLGSHSTGYKFGMLALEIAEHFRLYESKASVHVMVYALIWDWNKPIRLAIKPLQHSYRLALVSGDINVAMLAAYQCCVKLFYVAPLEELARDTSDFLNQMRSHDHNTLGTYISIMLQLSHNFMGLSDNPIILTGDVIDQEEVLKSAVEAQHVRLQIAVYIYSLVLAYTFNDYEYALQVCKKAAVLKESKVCSFNICLLIFYEGLTSIALARKTPGDPKKQKEYCKVAKQNMRKMKKLAKQVPANCLHKSLVLEAEFDTFKGRYNEGLDKYQRAMNFANDEGFLHEHALIYERAGLAFYSRNDDETEDIRPSTTEMFDDKYYLSRACSYYKAWGAHAKVKQMECRYPFLTTVSNKPVDDSTA